MPGVVLIARDGSEWEVRSAGALTDAVYRDGMRPKSGTVADNMLALVTNSVVVPTLNDVVLKRDYDTDIERETFIPARLSTGALAALGAPGPATAFGGVMALLRRGHRSTCVAMIGDSTGDGYNAGNTSDPVDEWPQVVIKQLGADFPAYTVLERRWNDGAQGYDPEVVHRAGTGNGGGDRCAVFTKAAPGALQYSGAAITGDIEVRARIAPDAWISTGGSTIAAKWEGSNAQRSWLFMINADGTLAFQWTTDGVTNPGAKNSTATVPSAGATNGQPYWVRVLVDVDNGASGSTVTFGTSPDGVTWTQLGTPVVTAGVSSMFGGTAPYQLGSFTTGFSTPLGGKIYDINIRAGLSSRQSVVPRLPDDWDYQSAQGTVSFAGAPVLTLLNGSASGQNVAYFDNATRRGIVHQPHGQSVLIVSTSHNDNLPSRAQWLSSVHTMITNIKGLLPYVPILLVGQNPVGLGGPLAIPQQGVELRATRAAMLQQYAASQAGVHAFDVWPYLTAADTSDQLHPTAGPGSGSEKWGQALYQRIR